MSNSVYIGTSLDGYISARDGDLDWMSYVPIPEGDDLGFSEFMDRVDARTHRLLHLTQNVASIH